jgi:hypothetical protein
MPCKVATKKALHQRAQKPPLEVKYDVLFWVFFSTLLGFFVQKDCPSYYLYIQNIVAQKSEFWGQILVFFSFYQFFCSERLP